MIICGIPQQLQNSRYRFVRIRMIGEKARKAPKDTNWIQQNNFTWDHPILHQWIVEGRNYGVMAGSGNLYIIDSDSEVLTEYLQTRLIQTFTVKTERGFHFYIHTEGYHYPEKYAHFGSFIGIGAYVVGPGSINIHDHEYTIFDNSPIATISKEFLNELLEPFHILTNPQPQYTHEPEKTTLSCHNHPITAMIIGIHEKRYRCNQTLRNPNATGKDRYGLIRTLESYTKWNELELCAFIKKHNSWINYSQQKTNYQINQIYKTINPNFSTREQTRRLGGG